MGSMKGKLDIFECFTVGGLIEELQKYDKDLCVIKWGDCLWGPVEEVFEDEKYGKPVIALG